MPRIRNRGFLLATICAGVFLSSCSSTPKAPDPVQQQLSPIGNVQSVSPERPLVPPEVVRLQSVQISEGVKLLTMRNAAGEYHLSCNPKAMGCETLTPNRNYLLFNNHTYWKLPKAMSYIDLEFIQDWTVTYNRGENVGLIPEDGASTNSQLGMYMLDSWKATDH